MTNLTILVDYDNLRRSYARAGPINIARALIGFIPFDVLSRYQEATVRFYGGWREGALLTNAAQIIIPEIRTDSPFFAFTTSDSQAHRVKVKVVLADGPIGGTQPLERTLVRNRSLRSFRPRPTGALNCIASSGVCGLAHLSSITEKTGCTFQGCNATVSDLLVRDEQKMVDTLLVADIAYEVFVRHANDLVVVSSDVDMWPGILLALEAQCTVLQVHTVRGATTPAHLVNGLHYQTVNYYRQTSV